MSTISLKGRPPFPFSTIGVAVAFSPRLGELLSEAKILAESCGAKILLIHVGKKNTPNETTLRDHCKRLGFSDPHTPHIIWQEGETVPALLEACKQNGVDLLVLGALRRENVLRHYLGSVARGISRAAKCSLLLLTEPKSTGTSFKKLVVCGNKNPKTIHTIDTAAYLATRLGAQHMTVVSEFDHPGLTMAMACNCTAGQASQTKLKISNEAADTVSDIVKMCSPGSLTIKKKAIPGRPGHAIRQYAATCKADLLVINSPDSRYGLIDRIFPHDMEYILEDLPCSVLIVHSRVT